MRRVIAAVVVLSATFLFTACGNGADDGNGGSFEFIVHPEFVQGALPRIPVTLLVTVQDREGSSGTVSLSASFPGGTVKVSPESVSAGEIAEVTITADDVDEESESLVNITAKRGSVELTASRTVAVIPGADDLGPTAAELLAIFTKWLTESHPELGIGPDRAFDGNVVAPRLLVVSHYMFADEEYELGLSWHVTIPPHDWAELYVRPRNALTPTSAFRMSSWSAALEGDDVEFSDVSPPEEVVR